MIPFTKLMRKLKLLRKIKSRKDLLKLAIRAYELREFLKPKQLDIADVDNPKYQLADGDIAKLLGLQVTRWRYLKGHILDPPTKSNKFDPVLTMNRRVRGGHFYVNHYDLTLG